MILLVAGTQYPFDRLVQAVDEAVAAGLVPGGVVGQIGRSRYWPRSFEAHAFLDRERFEELLAASDGLVCHAGVGTILLALEHGKPALVLPRRAALGEHVNDHQMGTAERLAAAGKVLLARDETDIRRLLPALAGFRPGGPAGEPGALVRRVAECLRGIATSRGEAPRL